MVVTSLFTRVLAAWLLLATLTAPAWGATPLRLGLETGAAPFSFLDESGQPHGVAVEFWQAWARERGEELHLRLGSPRELLEELRQGRLDAVGEYLCAAETSAGDQCPSTLPPGLRVAAPYAHLPVHLFFSRKLHGVKDFKDLAGMRLGVVEGAPLAGEAGRRVPFGAVVVPYEHMEALATGAALGEVQAFLAFRAAGEHALARLGVERDFVLAPRPVLQARLTVALRQDDVATAARLEPHLAAFAARERGRIMGAWQGDGLGSRLPWRAIGAVSLTSLGALVAVAVWNQQVRRRVRLATAQLLTANEALAREVATRREAEENLAGLNRQLEERVHLRTKALGEQASALQAANERLQRIDEAKTNFLAAVSHELRTPVTSLRGFAKLLLRDFEKVILPCLAAHPDKEGKARRMQANLRIMQQEGERLTRLVNDYLDLSRIEAGRMLWRDKTIQPVEALHRATHAVAGRVAEKGGLRLVVEAAPDLPPLHMDPDRLDQVLINLLSNAVKFTERGQVRLQAQRENGHVRFEVLDDGPGIPPEDRDRIFGKFERLIHDDTLQATDAVGTGLGLSICKQIVEHYAGRIWVDDNNGQGSVFRFTIPVERD